MTNKKTFGSYLLIVIAILVLVNILSDSFFARLDLTEDNRYTLSPATKNILEAIDEPVTVKAYFTKEGLPPQYLKVRRDFMEMLVEFNNLSKGNLVYDFIDPNEDASVEQEAMQAGIQQAVISVREKDQMLQKKVYMGAVISLGDESEVIPFVKEGAAMEYELSRNIKKLSVIDKPYIGFVQGHGEPGIAQMTQVAQELNVLNKIEEVTLSDATDLSKYAVLTIISPKDSFMYDDFMKLDQYLAQGGKLFVAINRVHGDLSTAQGSEITTGLESWLQQKGLLVESNFIIDQTCNKVSVRQPGFPFPVQVPFYYFPIIRHFDEHPITKGLELVWFPFVSTISYTGDENLMFQPLAKTSQKSGTQPCPTFFNVSKRWTEDEFPLSNLVVAGILSGNIVGDTESKIVLVADGDFAVNGEGQNSQQQPDNINFMVNSIDWLSDDTGLIELRTKGVTARILDEVEDSSKLILKWLNFLLPIILVIVYGFIRMQRKRVIRVKRMEKGYI